MRYFVLFEVIVEGPHPNVADHDVGGLEDGSDGAYVFEREKNSFRAECKSLASAETSAVAQDFVAGVINKVPLRR